MKRLATLLLLLSLQETLRVDVSVTTVGVQVMDSRGREVRGLKAEDFQVFEDGVPQKIAFFSSETQPITLGILVDRSSSMTENKKMDRAKEAARALVGGAREGSEYFYVEFDDNVNLAAEFTTDRQSVTAAIQRTVPGGGTSLYDAILEGIAQTGQAQLARQALVIISDGADQHSTHTLQEIINIVRESRIQIYTIGYFSKEEETIFRTSGTKMRLTNGEEVDNPRLALNRIAEGAGAKSYFPKSDEELSQAVAEINRDLATQYTVSFYRKDSNPETSYHQLRVQVNGGKYSVRARPGYGTREFPAGTARHNALSTYESNIANAAGKVSYKDDFGDPKSGWPQRPKAQYTREGYRLTGENMVVVNGPVFRNFEASASFSLEESVKAADLLPRVGNTQLPFSFPSQPVGGGLIFRQMNEGYYALLVFLPSGVRPGYAAAFRTEGLKVTEVERWTLPNRLARDYKIMVRCQESSCELFEGGTRFGRLKDVAFSEGRTGLLVSGNGEALFHNLTVQETQ